MDHNYIEEYNIADRYLLGKLPAEEQARFEEHFIDCPKCLDRLETTEDFRRGLQTVVAEEAARASSYLQVGFLAWLIRRRRWQQATLLLTSILLLAVLPSLLFLLRIRHLQGELSLTKNSAVGWQQQYEETQQAADQLKVELREAKVNEARINETKADSGEPRNRVGSRPAREQLARTGIAHQAERSARPQSIVPIFALGMVRSADLGSAEPPNKISIPSSSKLIVLSLELVVEPEVQTYRATIFDADRRVVWKASNLKPLSNDELGIMLSGDLFRAGDYLLTLEGLTKEGRYIPEGKYRFRSVRTK